MQCRSSSHRLINYITLCDTSCHHKVTNFILDHWCRHASHGWQRPLFSFQISAVHQILSFSYSYLVSKLTNWVPKTSSPGWVRLNSRETTGWAYSGWIPDCLSLGNVFVNSKASKVAENQIIRYTELWYTRKSSHGADCLIVRQSCRSVFIQFKALTTYFEPMWLI